MAKIGDRSGVTLADDLERSARQFAAMPLAVAVVGHSSSSIVGGAGWDRLVHMQPFEFDAGGRPVFGQPQPPGTPIERPQPSEGDR